MLCWMPLQKNSQAYRSSITHSTRQLLNEATKFSTKSSCFIARFLAENSSVRHRCLLCSEMITNPTSCFWDMDVRKATRRNPFFSIPFFFLNKEQKVYFLFCNGIYIPTHKNQIVDTLEIPSLQFAGFQDVSIIGHFFSQVGSTGSCALWWVLPLHCHKVEGHATTLGCLGVGGG